MNEFYLKFVIIFVLFVFSIPILIACACGIYNVFGMFLRAESNFPTECESDIENSC